MTLLKGFLFFISCAIACIKWVLPNPTPPYKNKGLNGTSLASETLLAAAKASSFGFPTMKFANVNLLSRSELIDLKTSWSFLKLFTSFLFWVFSKLFFESFSSSCFETII